MTDKPAPRTPPPGPPTGRDEDAVLAAEYALGLLTQQEARSVETRLAADPAFRALYARWAEDFARLTDDIAPVPPPPAVQKALHGRLFPEERQGWIRRLGLIPALLGAFVAAALVLYVGNLGLLGPDPAVGPRFAATIAAEDASLVVQVRFDPTAGILEIDRQAGDALAGRVLELWLIAGAAPPVSLGVLAEAEATLILDPAVAVVLADAVLAISDEPPGGSPTGAPTGAVLAVGQVNPL